MRRAQTPPPDYIAGAPLVIKELETPDTRYSMALSSDTCSLPAPKSFSFLVQSERTQAIFAHIDARMFDRFCQLVLLPDKRRQLKEAHIVSGHLFATEL